MKNRLEEQPWATTLTGVDEATQTPLAVSTPEKGGPSQNYRVKSTCDFIRRMAYSRVTARVDQEPALVDLLEKVKDRALKEHDIKVNLQLAPRYSSQSLGAVGAAQRALHEQIRCYKYDVETRYGVKLDPNLTLWPWLVRWAGTSIECFRIRANGITSYQDNYGVAYRSEVLPFAETALFRFAMSKMGTGPKDLKISKADLRFERGIALGKVLESGEHIFGTREGTYTTRTVKRLPKQDRADRNLLLEFIGTPWDSKAEKPRGDRRKERYPPFRR